MARSFTLRQGVGLGGGGTDGSQLRNPAGVDTALRSDNYASLPSNPIDAYFNAAPLTYDTIDLDWNIESSVSWLRVVIVASTTGHPVTILDGRQVANFSSSEALYSLVDTGLTPGTWYYYTLFAQINDGINTYYTALKQADALLPKNYGSTDYLFNRIPEYYRIADAELGAGLPGPLYRYVELFGYEMDYTRTLLDTVRDVRNLSKVPVPILKVVGNMLGIGPEAEGISESRYRYLCQNIMHLRLKKGTLAGIRGYISAISGYQADIQTVSATRIDIRMYAQRVNLIKNPKFAGTTLWTFGGSGTTSTASNVLTVTNGTGSTATTTVLSNVFPVMPGKSYAMGFRLDQLPAGATVTAQVLWYDGSITTTVTMPFKVAAQTGTTVQRLTTDALVAPGGTISAQVQLSLSIPAGQAVKLTQVIVEPGGAVGEYFDGDTKSGGYLPGSTGQFDFRWDSSIDGSYSYYNLDFGATKQVILNAMPYIIPVGVTVGGASGYTITEWSYFYAKS